MLPESSAAGRQSGLELTDLRKSYGQLQVIGGMSATIPDGTLVSLLGPSGSGKTTVLRIVGGFTRADHGRVILAGRDVTHLPPNRRNVGMVFQGYGLFPHMTVRQNVAYGLRMRRVPRAERQDRVSDVLGMVRLSGFDDRFPGQLSGGQQQRVAIARAVVIQPSLLLLDEPLSNLDAKLREEMRQEIRRLQQETRLTTLFVTHDQDEALALSDEVIVMNAGRVEQVGTPAEIYGAPANLFIAQFVGEANLLHGALEPAGDGVSAFRTEAGFRFSIEGDSGANGPALVSIRPEAILIGDDPAQHRAMTNVAEARIDAVAFHGAFTLFTCTLQSGDKLAILHPNRDTIHQPSPRAGHVVQLAWPFAAGRIIR